jgi:hypothetical protein
MKYAVRDQDGEIVTIFEADSLGEAVALKLQFRRAYGERYVIDDDEIFTVREATPKEIRAFRHANWWPWREQGRGRSK